MQFVEINSQGNTRAAGVSGGGDLDHRKSERNLFGKFRVVRFANHLQALSSATEPLE
jgi:hypothetical protein